VLANSIDIAVELLADSQKFGRTLFNKVCGLERFDLLITDRRLRKILGLPCGALGWTCLSQRDRTFRLP